jgi:predicted anti-sigma-YlaC factor YlaD
MSKVTQIYGSHDEQWQTQISSYIDGALSGDELARFEQHLATCPACQTNLATMQKTVNLVQSLPQIRAPRSFALTPEQAEALRPSKGFKWASLGAAAVAMLLIALFALEFAGIFNVIKEEIVESSSPPVSPIAFVTAIPCPTGAVNCFSTGNTVIPPLERPVIKETKTITVSETAAVRVVQVALGISFGCLIMLAFALRPRAPTKRKLRI